MLGSSHCFVITATVLGAAEISSSLRPSLALQVLTPQAFRVEFKHGVPRIPFTLVLLHKSGAKTCQP